MVAVFAWAHAGSTLATRVGDLSFCAMADGPAAPRRRAVPRRSLSGWHIVTGHFHRLVLRGAPAIEVSLASESWVSVWWWVRSRFAVVRLAAGMLFVGAWMNP